MGVIPYRALIAAIVIGLVLWIIGTLLTELFIEWITQ